MNIIPKEIINIIFDYENQLKKSKVLKELLLLTSDFNKKCSNCNKEFCSIHNIKCDTFECDKIFCNECFIEEINYNHSLDYFENQEIRSIRNMNSHEELLCNNCKYMYISEDESDIESEMRERFNDEQEESVYENWEDLDNEERYGIYTGY